MGTRGSLYCDDLVHDYWGQRRVLLGAGLLPHCEDDESDDGEPEVAGHFAEVLPAEDFSLVQVVETKLSKEEVDKLERR